MKRDPGRRRSVVGLRIRIFYPPRSDRAMTLLIGGQLRQASRSSKSRIKRVILGIPGPAPVELPELVDRPTIPGSDQSADTSRPRWSNALSGSMVFDQAIDLAAEGRGPSGANRSSGRGRDARRTIDHVEGQLVEISDLVHRFDHAEPKQTPSTGAEAGLGAMPD